MFFAIEIIACLDNLSGWLILAYRISRTASKENDFFTEGNEDNEGKRFQSGFERLRVYSFVAFVNFCQKDC
jgi:hypothetical protein